MPEARSVSVEQQTEATRRTGSLFVRILPIGVIAFLTLVDLFAAQAILPALALRYGASPGAIGAAVNACTLGMALASVAVAAGSMRIDRRLGIVASLALLAVPTTLLAHAPDLAIFAALRVAQGMCMATAFTLTLAYLGERFTTADAVFASAAYITGNVASNLFGRLLSAAVADHAGLAWSFYAFAVLNAAGAVLAAATIGARSATKVQLRIDGHRDIFGWTRAWPLIQVNAIGFCILFAFIGTFSYVNFVLTRAPLSIGQMQLGLIYLLFLPSLFTTPFAGRLAQLAGTQTSISLSLLFAIIGLPLLLVPSTFAVLTGLGMVAVGTFMAQAIATGHVSRTMLFDRGLASGLYLGSYFSGGLVGAAVLGQVFDHLGWPACVAIVGLALGAAVAIARRL